MINAETRANAAAVMGYLVHAAGGIEGRVRLQKSLYLLQRKGARELKPFPFSYHHYGPYSERLAGLLEELVKADLIKEGSQRFEEEWQRFEYLPGSRATEFASLVSDNTRSLIDQLVKATRGSHWRTLELAATIDFLRRDGLSREQAANKALELKPACRDFRSNAERLLDRLTLN